MTPGGAGADQNDADQNDSDYAALQRATVDGRIDAAEDERRALTGGWIRPGPRNEAMPGVRG
jgi:hypothetical protein